VIKLYIRLHMNLRLKAPKCHNSSAMLETKEEYKNVFLTLLVALIFEFIKHLLDKQRDHYFLILSKGSKTKLPTTDHGVGENE
jgi:hypothetical protein